eukprot:1726894-Pleurochrysis_carterae.AAC.1
MDEDPGPPFSHNTSGASLAAAVVLTLGQTTYGNKTRRGSLRACLLLECKPVVQSRSAASIKKATPLR